jgi:hypothetical protein
MRAYINQLHSLSTYTDAVSKNHYPHIWIVVLEYADAVNNRIRKSCILHLINSSKQRYFDV